MKNSNFSKNDLAIVSNFKVSLRKYLSNTEFQKRNNSFKISINKNFNSISYKFNSEPNTKKNNDYILNEIIQNYLKEKCSDDFEIKKSKRNYEISTVSNCNSVTFENQTNTNIFHFPVFNENLIFKNINKSYMAKAYDDDGNDSSEEKIIIEKNYVYDQLKDAVNSLQMYMKNGISSEKLFNRKYIYDFDKKNYNNSKKEI